MRCLAERHALARRWLVGRRCHSRVHLELRIVGEPLRHRRGVFIVKPYAPEVVLVAVNERRGPERNSGSPISIGTGNAGPGIGIGRGLLKIRGLEWHSVGVVGNLPFAGRPKLRNDIGLGIRHAIVIRAARPSALDRADTSVRVHRKQVQVGGILRVIGPSSGPGIGRSSWMIGVCGMNGLRNLIHKLRVAHTVVF